MDDNHINRAWTLVLEFEMRDYWDRIWILQEMALARKLWMMGGANIITWEYFLEYYHYLNRAKSSPLSRPEFVPFRLWIYFQLKSIGGRVERVEKAKRILRLSRNATAEENSKLMLTVMKLTRDMLATNQCGQ